MFVVVIDSCYYQGGRVRSFGWSSNGTVTLPQGSHRFTIVVCSHFTSDIWTSDLIFVNSAKVVAHKLLNTMYCIQVNRFMYISLTKFGRKPDILPF